MTAEVSQQRAQVAVGLQSYGAGLPALIEPVRHRIPRANGHRMMTDACLIFPGSFELAHPRGGDPTPLGVGISAIHATSQEIPHGQLFQRQTLL